MNQDGYVRLRKEGPLLGCEPSGPDPILFIDVNLDSRDSGSVPQIFRRVPHSYLATTKKVVVRGSEDEAAGVEAVLNSLERKIGCARIVHNCGTPASIQGTVADNEADLIYRSRTVELNSLLELGEAVWEAKKFHFLLPSGRHARSLVRPSHAIRNVRDAQILAFWLLPYLDKNGTGVVIDTHTLTSVILALQIEAKNHGVEIGPVRILDGYPATSIDVTHAVQAVTEEATTLLAIISVCSTGTIRDLICKSALDYASLIERSEIVSIFDVASDRDPAKASKSSLQISSLLHLGGQHNNKKFKAYDSPCPLCGDAETARLIPVDMDTFDVRFPSFIEKEMPSITDPQRNRRLWEACDRSDALSFFADPDEPVRLWRATGKMTLKLEWGKLLLDDQFPDQLKLRIKEEIKSIKQIEIDKKRALTTWTDFDLVLTPQRDLNRDGMNNLWEKIGDAFSTAKLTPFPDQGDWPTSLLEIVRSARRILVFTLGTVTGTTLQRALIEIQRARSDTDYHLYGFVVHARPPRQRTWQVLVNSYAYKLGAAFLSFLPEDLSPLQDEFKHLEADANELSSSAQQFLGHRQTICKGESGSPEYGFLWGACKEEKISAHSIFGDRLGTRSTFVSVGSAIQARREASRNPPYRMLFEMPAIARSYYDPVIFSCMLRWLQPSEIWWGDSISDAEKVLGEVLARASEKQKPLLLGEMLLACAQGKIPQRGRDYILAQAEAVNTNSHYAGMFELGRFLVSQQKNQTAQ